VHDPSRWAVLYLGSAKVRTSILTATSSPSTARARSRKSARDSQDIEGVVLLDAPGPGQGAVVAQCLDAKMPARHPGPRKTLAVRKLA